MHVEEILIEGWWKKGRKYALNALEGESKTKNFSAATCKKRGKGSKAILYWSLAWEKYEVEKGFTLKQKTSALSLGNNKFQVSYERDQV